MRTQSPNSHSSISFHSQPILFKKNFLLHRQLRSAGRIRVHKHLLNSLLVYSVLMALLTLQILMPSNETTFSSSSSNDKLRNETKATTFHPISSPALIESGTTQQEAFIWKMLNKLQQSNEANIASAHSSQAATSPLPFTSIVSSSPSSIDGSTSRWWQWPDWYRPNLFCVLLSLAVKYFRSTSYLWMFNEALYLHQLIKRAFTTPSFKPLLLIAYGIPLVTTGVYVYFRAADRVDMMNKNQFEPMHLITTGTPYFGQTSSMPSFESLVRTNDEPIASSKHAALVMMSSIRISPIVDEKEKNSTNLIGRLFADTKDSNRVDSEDEQTIQILEPNESMDEDVCWSLPSRVAWHEWIINAPNLLILLVSLFCSISDNKFQSNANWVRKKDVHFGKHNQLQSLLFLFHSIFLIVVVFPGKLCFPLLHGS